MTNELEKKINSASLKNELESLGNGAKNELLDFYVECLNDLLDDREGEIEELKRKINTLNERIYQLEGYKNEVDELAEEVKEND